MKCHSAMFIAVATTKVVLRWDETIKFDNLGNSDNVTETMVSKENFPLHAFQASEIIQIELYRFIVVSMDLIT